MRENSKPRQSGQTCTGAVVLVIDDSKVQRRILQASLRRWGYSVLEADSGEAAMEICRNTHVDLVLSDWMMPGMNGLEFCKAFRALDRDGYGYFILLTSKSEKGEIARGLEVGADDFLTKPVNADELKARLAAGERILKMERELQQKNKLVSETLDEMRGLYDTIDRDLMEAKKLQHSLARETYRSFGKANISLTLRPSGHVGGDMVGMFPINENEVGVFALDVSGHGITSALMTARLTGYLSGSHPDQNVALQVGPQGQFQPRPPSEAVARLNALVLEEMDTEHYFTILLGHIDLRSGAVVLCQAGHPNPVVQRRHGEVETVGTGGLPVGLLDFADYHDFKVFLEPGDRLLLPSDGITECPELGGGMLEDAGLLKLVAQHRDSRGEEFLESLIWSLSSFSGLFDFPDDVSAVFIEYNG